MDEILEIFVGLFPQKIINWNEINEDPYLNTEFNDRAK